MSGSTTFAGIKYAEAADEVNKFPVNVSEPGAKTIDAYLEEHTLSYKTRAASFEAKSGELSECTKALTVTLPAATVNRLIGVVNIPAVAGELVKVTTSGGAFIYGDVIPKEATITLTERQHVLLFANGTNWFIIAGEPKRPANYVEAAKARAKATLFTASAARPSIVILTLEGAAGASAVVSVSPSGPGSNEYFQLVEKASKASMTFPLIAGEQWQWNFVGTEPTVLSTYIVQ